MRLRTKAEKTECSDDRRQMAVLPKFLRDRLKAALIEGRTIAAKEGYAEGPLAGVRHILRTVAQELWPFCAPDLEEYTARLIRAASWALDQFGESASQIHPIDVKLLIDEHFSTELAESAQQGGTSRYSCLFSLV